MSELPQTVSQVLNDYLRSASTAGIIVEDQDPDWGSPCSGGNDASLDASLDPSVACAHFRAASMTRSTSKPCSRPGCG